MRSFYFHGDVSSLSRMMKELNGIFLKEDDSGKCMNSKHCLQWLLLLQIFFLNGISHIGVLNRKEQKSMVFLVFIGYFPHL